MSFNNTESFCTMTVSVFYRKVLRLDVGKISWANLKCMNIVKLSVNQWTSIFPPSSPVWLNATCTLAVTDGGQRSAMLLSRTPDDDTLPHRQQQGSSWRSRGLSQTFPPSLYVCSPIAPTKSSPRVQNIQLQIRWYDYKILVPHANMNTFILQHGVQCVVSTEVQ